MTPRKRRLIIVCHLPPPVHGASMMGKVVAESQLLREKFDCVIIPIQMSADVKGLQSFAFAKAVAALKLYRLVLGSLIGRRPEAVYITVALNGFAAVRDLGLALLCRLFGVRRIFHLHMKGLKDRYEKSLLFRILYRMMFKGAAVIHLSDRLYYDVEPVVDRTAFHVVANGVPDSRRSVTHSPPAGGDAESRSSDHKPEILFMSNLFEDKGPLDLLEAGRRLRSERVPHRLIFIGANVDAAVTETLTRAAELDSTGSIELRGPLYGEEKEAVLDKVQIFAFPTYYRFECQPLVVIEAMSHSLGIVAPDDAGIPELVRDGKEGLLTPLRDVDALTCALRNLLLDANRREQLGKAARERYEEFFTLEAFERRFVAVIEKIVG